MTVYFSYSDKSCFIIPSQASTSFYFSSIRQRQFFSQSYYFPPVSYCVFPSLQTQLYNFSFQTTTVFLLFSKHQWLFNFSRQQRSFKFSPDTGCFFITYKIWLFFIFSHIKVVYSQKTTAVFYFFIDSNCFPSLPRQKLFLIYSRNQLFVISSQVMFFLFPLWQQFFFITPFTLDQLLRNNPVRYHKINEYVSLTKLCLKQNC